MVGMGGLADDDAATGREPIHELLESFPISRIKSARVDHLDLHGRGVLFETGEVLRVEGEGDGVPQGWIHGGEWNPIIRRWPFLHGMRVDYPRRSELGRRDGC